MACLYPFRLRNPQYSKFEWINVKYNLKKYIEVPCGRCLLCRVSRRTWLSAAGEYEFSKSRSSAFVTLTYSDFHLARNCLVMQKDGRPLASLRRSDLQDFLRELRRVRKFFYLAAGEYGQNPVSSDIPRPHYHIVLLGFDFYRDKKLLHKIWSKGIVDCRAVSRGAFRYVAKYLDKYNDFSDFDVLGLERPFICHSQGFGRGLIFDNLDDVISNNYTYVYKNRRFPIPSYYRRKLFGIRKPDFSSITYEMFHKYHIPYDIGSTYFFTTINKFRKYKAELQYERARQQLLSAGDPAPSAVIHPLYNNHSKLLLEV